MEAIKVTFHNDQEEKDLLSILDSLNYDYEPQFSSSDDILIKEVLERSEKQIADGKFSKHHDVMDRVKAKYGL